MKHFVAERRLLFSLKGSSDRRELVIRIGMPYLVNEGMVGQPVEEGVAACSVEFDGLSEDYPEIYGNDTLQALYLAVNVEPVLERLHKKYDIYWPSGEPYFDESLDE